MKLRNQQPPVSNNREHVVMEFGRAQLVRNATGKLELKGASPEERTDAKEYISLFMHEAVVSLAE